MFQAVMSVLFDLQASDGIVPEALLQKVREVMLFERFAYKIQTHTK